MGGHVPFVLFFPFSFLSQLKGWVYVFMVHDGCRWLVRFEKFFVGGGRIGLDQSNPADQFK